MNEEVQRQQEQDRRWNRRETGCLIVGLIPVGLILLGWLSPKQKSVDVRAIGQVKRSVFTGPVFKFAVWHQHPGNLKNGRVWVWIKGKAIPADRPPAIHSFESWAPNQEHAVPVSCPLSNYDPAEPIVVEVLVKAANARDTSMSFVWQGNGWKE